MFDSNHNRFHFEPNLVKSDVWKWKTVETIATLYICKNVVAAIPFVPDVARIFTLMSCACFGIITIKGIGEMSVMQRIISEIRYLRRRRKLHLRSPEYIRKERTNANSRDNKSFIEASIEKFSSKTSEWIEKYSGEEEEG